MTFLRLVLNELHKTILEIYRTAQSTSASDFSEKIFSQVKYFLNFDSGGFCDFVQIPHAGLKLVAAVAHNVSTADKLRLREEYIGGENIVDTNSLATEDPSLVQAFHRKGTAVTFSVASGNHVKPNVAAYGAKTESLQTLTMIQGVSDEKSFQILSLWRAKADHDYTKSDESVANIILPHVFQAFSIHRQLYANTGHAAPAAGTAICSLSRQISFIDDAAVKFLHDEFPDWLPPFIPEKLMDGLRSTSEKVYVGKKFTVIVLLKNDSILLRFRPLVPQTKLSATELVVAEMLAKNASYKEIARQLGSQPATVRNQAHSVYTKFGISGKAELSKMMQNLKERDFS